jgi:hypothetical protein
VPSKVGRPARQIADAPAAGGRERAVTKLGELVMILDLHRQGPSVRAITRQLGVDLETVRAYIAKGLEPPVYKRRAPTPGIVDQLRSLFARSIPPSPRCDFGVSSKNAASLADSVVPDRVRELRPSRPAGNARRNQSVNLFAAEPLMHSMPMC